MLVGWTKYLALASDSQILLCKPHTRPPRDVSRVHEPETVEETAFDIPSTLKIKAKRAFDKEPSGLAKPRAWGKCLETFHQIQSEASGPALVITSCLQLVSFQSNCPPSSSGQPDAKVLALTPPGRCLERRQLRQAAGI